MNNDRNGTEHIDDVDDAFQAASAAASLSAGIGAGAGEEGAGVMHGGICGDDGDDGDDEDGDRHDPHQQRPPVESGEYLTTESYPGSRDNDAATAASPTVRKSKKRKDNPSGSGGDVGRGERVPSILEDIRPATSAGATGATPAGATDYKAFSCDRSSLLGRGRADTSPRIPFNAMSYIADGDDDDDDEGEASSMGAPSEIMRNVSVSVESKYMCMWWTDAQIKVVFFFFVITRYRGAWYLPAQTLRPPSTLNSRKQKGRGASGEGGGIFLGGARRGGSRSRALGFWLYSSSFMY